MDREYTSDIAFTPAVKAAQERLGSRPGYARMEEKGGWSDRVTPDLAAFIAERDSFYMATANAEGITSTPANMNPVPSPVASVRRAPPSRAHSA